jgi:hypothetical protein
LDDDDDDTWPHSQTKFWTLMMIHGHSDNWHFGLWRWHKVTDWNVGLCQWYMVTGTANILDYDAHTRPRSQLKFWVLSSPAKEPFAAD